MAKVKCSDGTTFTFHACSLSINGTNHLRGQIPQILYYRLDSVSVKQPCLVYPTNTFSKTTLFSLPHQHSQAIDWGPRFNGSSERIGRCRNYGYSPMLTFHDYAISVHLNNSDIAKDFLVNHFHNFDQKWSLILSCFSHIQNKILSVILKNGQSMTE